jgi:hypothetical protein
LENKSLQMVTKRWMENRTRSFRGSLGISEGYCLWNTAQYPDQRYLSAMNYFLYCLLSVSKVGAVGTSRLSNMFNRVLWLQGWDESYHSNWHIFNEYPELLRIRLLWDMLTYNAAMEFPYRIPTGERTYVKFLYSKDNRNNFSLLAAVVVTRYEIPSFRLYRGEAEVW